MEKHEWCWYRVAPKEDGCAHGPQPTRQEAIAEAMEYYNGEGLVTIALGHPIYARSYDYIPIDANSLVESMDEQAWDNDFGFAYNDPIFEIPSGQQKAAEEELDKLLKDWARKWVVTSGQWVLHETERLEIKTNDHGEA